MSNIYALLIGVDFYFEHTLPDGSYFPSLGGCVRDIRHVESYLTDPARLNIPKANILMLTASDDGNEFPVEPEEQWPTYENMVAKFQEITAMAEAGDQLYIQYSGHGGRATTIYPDIKEATGADETLVPLDIGDENTRYLRDVELYYLIDQMVRKGLRVTVVFDSCHSGGATRDAGKIRKRGRSKIDTTPRPADSLVAPTATLTAAWQNANAGNTRAAKPASGWLLEPKGYTFLAACRANESAFEYPFNGNESNGALTYWMLDTLRQAGPEFTYKMLHDRIVAKVHGQFEQQTPLLQGEGDIRVFGSDRIPPVYAVALLEVDSGGTRVRLNAGEVHGVTLATQFAIYPNGTTDFSAVDKRLAVVEVDQVDEVESWAKVTTQGAQGTLDAGAQAILLQSSSLRTRRTIQLAIDDASIKAQVECAIETWGLGFVAVATGEESDFLLSIGQQQEYIIGDATGAPLPNLRRAIAVKEQDAAKKLVQRLVHLAKYYNVRELPPPDLNGTEKLQITLTSLSGNGEAIQEAGGVPIFKPGDKVKLVVKNNQQPGEVNDPARVLNITILDLAPDWSVTQIFPSGAAAFESLDPQATFAFEFEAFLTNGHEEGTDTLKIFATRSTTNFRWLQLPALDQPPIEQPIKRSGIEDALEKLIASVTDEAATTRAVRLTSGPQSRNWTVAQVDLRVKA